MAPASFPALRGTNEGYRKSTAARVVAFCRLLLRLPSFFPNSLSNDRPHSAPWFFQNQWPRLLTFAEIQSFRWTDCQCSCLITCFVAFFPFQKLEISSVSKERWSLWLVTSLPIAVRLYALKEILRPVNQTIFDILGIWSFLWAKVYLLELYRVLRIL